MITFIIIIVPYLIVNIFIRDDEIKFIYHENMTIRVKRSNDMIEEVPFEQYIIGVLAGEMPVSFDIEALKAQAVAARSYVMKKMADNKDKEYDVLDTVADQVYLDENYLKNVWKDNYVENINKLKKAILETKGEYLEYNNKVALAFYFSTSPGVTENGEEIFGSKVEYLKSVPSKWDQKVSPIYITKNNFALSDFCNKLAIKCTDQINVDVLKTTSTGRIAKIKINDKIFTGSKVRELLNLKSSFFSISQSNNNILVITKGYGHGVGMSQYGALGMAQEGYKYDQILKHYYQGIKIKKI